MLQASFSDKIHKAIRFVGGLLFLFSLLSTSVLGQEFYSKKLDNGLQVYFLPSQSPYMVSCNVVVRFGGLYEQDHNAGIAHLYEHMFFRGTPTYSGLSFKQNIESLGGLTDATTSYDSTHFQINIPKQHWKEGLALMSDATWNAQVTEDAISKEMPVVMEEYRLFENNPGVQFQLDLRSKLYPSHPYGRPVIGSKSSIASISRNQLLSVKERYYHPENMIVVVAGDLAPSLVFNEVERLFSQLSRPLSPPQIPRVSKPLAETVRLPNRSVYNQKVIAFQGPKLQEHQDLVALDLLMFILNGSGEHSLRTNFTESGVASSASMSFQTQHLEGPVIFQLEASRADFPASAKLLEQFIFDLPEKSFTEAEILEAKRRLSTLHLQQRSTVKGLADQFSLFALYGQEKLAQSYLDILASLTAQDLQVYAKKHLDLSRSVKYIFGRM